MKKKLLYLACLPSNYNSLDAVDAHEILMIMIIEKLAIEMYVAFAAYTLQTIPCFVGITPVVQILKMSWKGCRRWSSLRQRGHRLLASHSEFLERYFF